MNKLEITRCCKCGRVMEDNDYEARKRFCFKTIKANRMDGTLIEIKFSIGGVEDTVGANVTLCTLCLERAIRDSINEYRGIRGWLHRNTSWF